MLGEGTVGEVVGPMGKVKGEVFVSLAPDVADLGIALDNQGLGAKDLQPSSKGKTTIASV